MATIPSSSPWCPSAARGQALLRVDPGTGDSPDIGAGPSRHTIGLGVAIADIIKDYSRTVMMRGDDIKRARLDEEFHDIEGLPIDRMAPQRIAGHQISGPAIVLQMDTTVVITPGWSGSVDDYGNLVLAAS